MRLDRWLRARYPGLPAARIGKLVRTGQVRIDRARAQVATRVKAGQSIRVPPVTSRAPPMTVAADEAGTPAIDLRALVLYEDEDLFVLNKPFGLAAQGGRGLETSLDGLLGQLQGHSRHHPRLVHRLDRETSGVTIVARRRSVAAYLSDLFRRRAIRKVYWALCFGVPRRKQGRLSDFLAGDSGPGRLELQKIAAHGDRASRHALTDYATVETCGTHYAWLALRPLTGRTHQLRVQLFGAGHAIVGERKYRDKRHQAQSLSPERSLHLLSRRVGFLGPSGQSVDVSAPLAPHMSKSFSLLGLNHEAKEAQAVTDALFRASAP